MNNNPENDQLGLDNLEFFENVATEDPLEDPQYDPNANLAPDILAGEKLDLAEDDLPMGGQEKSSEPNPTAVPNDEEPADFADEDNKPDSVWENDWDSPSFVAVAVSEGVIEPKRWRVIPTSS